MRVLVYEPKFVGHFLGFATWSANAFVKLGYDVTMCVSQQAEATQQAAVKLSRLGPDIDLQYVIPSRVARFSRWQNARFETDVLLENLDRLEPDFLVVPSGDFLIGGMLISGRLRRAVRRLKGAELILHACPQAYPALGPRDRLLKLLDRLCVDSASTMRLHTVDPYATLAQSGAMSLFGKQVHALPHPFEPLTERPQREARQRLGLPDGRRIIASMGDLGVRKGTDILVRSFVDSGVAQHDISLFLAGVLSKDVRAIIDAHRQLVDDGQIYLRDQFVSDDVFSDAFYAADALWAGYPRQIGIASVLLFAAEARRPVIAADNGCVGWMTREYGLGVCFDPFQTGDAARALRWMVAHPELTVDQEGAERLLATHNLDNFERELTRQAVKIAPPRRAVMC